MEDIEQLMAKLNTQDKGQALRRATRQCTVDQFEALIKQFKDLTIGDKPVVDAPDSIVGQHYTPLHVTLQDDNDTKAAKLIVLGKASVDSKSRELYQQAAPTSKIKRNPVLGKLLQ